MVGPIAYGCWRFADSTDSEALRKITTAVECGMTLIDTADVYGFDGAAGFGDAERVLGRVLADTPSLRDEIVLATKGGIDPGLPYDSSTLVERCDRSLERLGVDHVDLYQVHRPDLLAHPIDVAASLAHIRESGRAREVGISNFTPSQARALAAAAAVPIATTQPEFSVSHTDPIDDGVLDLAMELGQTPLAWSPLGGGSLFDGQDSALSEVLGEIAGTHRTDAASVSLAWVLAHPSRPIPIIGTQRV